MLTNGTRSAVALVLAAFVAFSANAQDCQRIEASALDQSYENALRALTGFGCLGQAKRATDVIVASFIQLAPDADGNSEARAKSVKVSNDLLLDYASGKAAVVSPNQSLWTDVAFVLSQQSVGILRAMQAGTPGEAEAFSKEAISVDSWVIDSNSGNVVALSGRSVFSGVSEHCPTSEQGQSPTCEVYEDRKNLIILIKLAGELSGYSGRGVLHRHLLEARIASKKWDAYFNDTHFQWWWEVAFNGRRMLKSGNCDENDSTEIREGFCKVPDSQMILFHPDIALHYVGGADSSDDLAPAFFIEVFGRNSWDWTDDGKTNNARGWSVIASYTNLSEQSDWGYGLMFHYRNQYSFGITSTSGDVGAILSIDLSDKLFERKAKYKNYLKTIQKPGFFEEVLLKE